ncbi:MAG: hypothetical protein JKX71_09090 [Amylibacter sp.]|nr:hypothetical protein [Amylibacter sp.]
MLKSLITASVLLGIATASLPAQAQTLCNKRSNVVLQLSEKYGEVSNGAGVQSATQVIELWSSQKTGSWTIIASRADGISCILATGR